MDIMLCLSLGRIYPWNMSLNIFSFPLFCLIWWSYFPSIMDLTFLVIYMIWAVIFSFLCKHLGVQLCQWDPVTFVGDISVTTDGRELCLLVRLVSTSRKMVLFVPRPWYRLCCRHNWHATLWHALLSWPCKRSAPFLPLNHMMGP